MRTPAAPAATAAVAALPGAAVDPRPASFARADLMKAPEPAPPHGGPHQVALRIAVAALLLPPVAWCLWRGGFLAAILLATAAAIATWEYYRLALGTFGFPEAMGVLSSGLLPTLPLLVPRAAAATALALTTLFSLCAWTSHVLTGPRPLAPTRIGHLLAGFLFPALGLWSLAELRAGSDGAFWAAAVVLGCWANDSGAFFVGKALGRHKLLAAVSPGRTWEGLGGGLLAGLAGLAGLDAVAGGHLAGPQLLVLAVVIGALGPLGDLSKSLLKRAYHAKDSGRLFPGHGGMLDRIDSILFCAPAVLAYRLLTGPLTG